jgi:polyisoprenyl-phosphate glycosyltransferase
MRKQPPVRDRAGTDVVVSVVLPVYNEARVLGQLVDRVDLALGSCVSRHEIVFVNDGSCDSSREVLNELADSHSHVKVLHFSRNFGHQAAVQAGLEHAVGGAVIVMDSDLQDDPACLPGLIEKWREGFDVVYAIRKERKECALKRFLFYSFYRFLNAITELPMPNDAGNFGLIDRKVVEAIKHLSDRDRFFPGLRQWVGYRQAGIPVERAARYDDRPRVSLRGLCRLAKSAVFSFSSLPLTVFYTIAVLALLVFAGTACFTLYHKFCTGLAIPGWTSVLMIACFFGAMNALGIAILGEYISRIYNQVRARPLYLVAEKRNFRHGRRARGQGQGTSDQGRGKDEIRRTKDEQSQSKGSSLILHP